MKLLFIPGAGGGREEWWYQTGYFPGSEVITLPGHPEGKPASSVDGYVAWLRAYLHQHQYQNVVLVGHSLGGAIAQLYGLRYGDEVKALVLVATGARLRVHPSILASLEAMVNDNVAWRKFVADICRRIDSKIRQAVVEARIRMGPAVMLSDFRCCDKFDIMGEVKAIKLPTLVIGGREDELTPIKYSRYLTANIEGATEVIIDGASHFVFAEKPEAVNQAIAEFLGGLD